MKKIGLVIMLVVLLAIPLASYGQADKDPQCVGKCGREYKACLEETEKLYKKCVEKCGPLDAKCKSECLMGQDWNRTQCDQINAGCIKDCKDKDKKSEIEGVTYAQVKEPDCVCAECGRKCGAGHATSCSSYQVSPSTGTAPSSPPKQKVCVQYKTLTIKYVCGTEQKCTQVKRKDSSSTGFHYETVCVDVEKYCTKSEEVCAEWGWQ